MESNERDGDKRKRNKEDNMRKRTPFLVLLIAVLLFSGIVSGCVPAGGGEKY